MTVKFETNVEQHALDYIRLHLREGYFVSAFVDKGNYHWQKAYKISVSKEDSDDNG